MLFADRAMSLPAATVTIPEMAKEYTTLDAAGHEVRGREVRAEAISRLFKRFLVGAACPKTADCYPFATLRSG
jgi:hypothetical protein